jgi:hypothetical protein
MSDFEFFDLHAAKTAKKPCRVTLSYPRFPGMPHLGRVVRQLYPEGAAIYELLTETGFARGKHATDVLESVASFSK